VTLVIAEDQDTGGLLFAASVCGQRSGSISSSPLPYYRFTIHSSADVTTAVLLLVTGIAVSQLAARVRQLKAVAITDEGYLAQIHETAALAESATLPDVVVDHVNGELTRLLDLEGSRFEYGSLLGHPPRRAPSPAAPGNPGSPRLPVLPGSCP
jgi:hypothetical protein